MMPRGLKSVLYRSRGKSNIATILADLVQGRKGKVKPLGEAAKAFNGRRADPNQGINLASDLMEEKR